VYTFRTCFPFSIRLCSLWLLLVFVAALLAGSVIFFLGILKGKEIEAKLQRRSQKLSRSILSGVLSE
jgi:hypothetical protein